MISDRRVLVGRRSAEAVLPGALEFPGGKVQPGETPEAAAVRECFEETGLRVEVTGLLDVISHRYPHGEVRLFFYCAKPIASMPPRVPFQWIAFEELDPSQFPPANAQIFSKLLPNL